MTLQPEKNDVSLEELFRWSKELVIRGREGKELYKCYIRLIGDSDLNRARVFALRKSAELRRALRDKESDYRLAYIMDLEMVEKENLVEMIVYMSIRDITLKSTKEVDIPFPIEPKEDASLEMQERFQEEIDNWPAKREAAVKTYIEKEVTKLRETLNTQSKEDLYRFYENSAINELCENEMATKFRDMCVVFGTYKDENFKERLFADFEKFNNLPAELKQEFIDAYVSLELSVDELKK